MLPTVISDSTLCFDDFASKESLLDFLEIAHLQAKTFQSYPSSLEQLKRAFFLESCVLKETYSPHLTLLFLQPHMACYFFYRIVLFAFVLPIFWLLLVQSTFSYPNLL
mmetsp:Transcript_25983/g.19569  ORF Transcript_25983/g.19569 Transcript_25983/m.19569 type:complete len:108 (-) Transcript_25983:243-566(-)